MACQDGNLQVDLKSFTNQHNREPIHNRGELLFPGYDSHGQVNTQRDKNKSIRRGIRKGVREREGNNTIEKQRKLNATKLSRQEKRELSSLAVLEDTKKSHCGRLMIILNDHPGPLMDDKL